MLDSIELQIARSKIQSYEHEADDAIVRASEQARDCLDCEEMLDKGIHALEWLERVEVVFAEASAVGICESTPELEEALASLHRDWLKPCEFAKKWIAKCHRNGYDMRNLREFLDCCDRAQEWLERNANYQQAKAAREERFAKESW